MGRAPNSDRDLGGAQNSDGGLGGAPKSDGGLGVHQSLMGPHPRNHPSLPVTSAHSLILESKPGFDKK